MIAPAEVCLNESQLLSAAYAAALRNCMKALGAIAQAADWTEADRNWHRRAVHKHFRDLARLNRRALKGEEGVRVLRDRLLTSFAGRLCGYLQEAGHDRLGSLGSLTPLALSERVKRLAPDRHLVGTMKLHTQSKSDGSKRVILSPSWQYRAAQRHVSDVWASCGQSNPFEHNSAGKGRDVAIQQVVNLMLDEGVTDFVQFDLKNYFTSVSPKHLKGVPLPRKVIEHSVFTNRKAILFHRKGEAVEAKTARHGLPQGARLSGTIASWLLGRELRQLDGAMGTVTYVDDVLIGACDPTGAKALAEAIKMRFGKLCGGPLSFKTFEIVSALSGFSFLGYWVRLRWQGGKPQVFVKPSHEAQVRLRRGVYKRLRELGSDINWDKAAVRAHKYLDSWLRSFSMWQPSDAELESLRGYVDVQVSDFLSGVPLNWKVGVGFSSII